MRLANAPGAILRALDYPYEAPDRGYRLAGGGRLAPLDGPVAVGDRRPVLAIGANRSPDQLSRKFPLLSPDEEIPVQFGRLRGYDVVYSAHFAVYGAIPATLHPAPGTSVRVGVMWLAERQVAHMHRTEAVGVNYDFVRLDGVAVRLDDADEVDSPACYLSRRGALNGQGQPVALADVAADGRRWPARDQRGVQSLARDRLDPTLDIEQFVTGTLQDAGLRAMRTARLAADALPFAPWL